MLFSFFLCRYLIRCSCLMNINSVILHQGSGMAVLRCSMKWTRSLAHYSKSLEGVFGNFLLLTRFRCQLKPTQIFARKYQSIKSWITVLLFLLFLSPASLIIVYPQKLSTQPRTNHFLHLCVYLFHVGSTVEKHKVDGTRRRHHIPEKKKMTNYLWAKVSCNLKNRYLWPD